MKWDTRFLLRRIGFVTLVLMSAGMLLQGCAQQGYSVIASTGTMIGVEVSQNPASQAPQAKLGYNRAELAFVPTNRAAGDDPGNSGGGARDSTNVLMELKYAGVFDLGTDSGIYQRLAVGDLAVKEPGAAAMFIKNADGTVDDNTVKALQALESIPTANIPVETLKGKISETYLKYKKENNASALKDFDEAVKGLQAGYSDFGAFAIDPKTSIVNVEKLKRVLEAKGYTF